MTNKMAVLVTSCDTYQDIWEPFFKLMDRYWGDITSNVYLNTETCCFNKQYDHFRVNTLNIVHSNTRKVSWSKRMMDVLDRIEEPYVFMIVEDFFLRERVQSELLDKLIDKMEHDKEIGQIQLFGTRINCDNQISNIVKDTVEIEEVGDGKAKVVFVPTIWRKETLKKWLRPHETIWAFEACGSQRAKRWHYKEKVYRVYSPAVFNYLWEKNCYCVVNGKWMIHPLLLNLFEDNGIYVDFNKRGTITMAEWNSVSMTTILKRNGVWGSLKKVIGRIRSLV